MVAMYGAKVFQDWCDKEVGSLLNVFHHYMMLVSILVICFVIHFLWCMMSGFSSKYRQFKEHEVLEWVWTVLPMLILGFLWVPSVNNLYLMNNLGATEWGFKVVGHQWYWSYEFEGSSHNTICLESYMDKSSQGEKYRLLEVDQRMVAPVKVSIRLLVTSADVLHSFAIPSCAVKVDAIPGRLNQAPLSVDKTCVCYGQCSELCGVNHSFMPIVVEFIPWDVYKAWLN
nr:cytochrome c oxidase subunit II [Semimytilus algosus]